MAVAPGKATDIDEVVRALRGARRVTAICHENPDADTIGAAVAVVLMARRLGAEAELVSADRIPPVFGFLPLVEQVRRRPELEADLAVICDAATLERVGRIAREQADWFARATVLNIDHHVSSNYFGDLNLVDPHAAATCEVLARVAERTDVELDSELATALLAGIVRDSQGFAEPSTSGDTLRIAARLVDAGAPLALIHRFILSELPYPTMALWGKMLAAMGQAADGRIVYTVLTQEMLDETGTQQHDADGMVEFLGRAADANIAMLLRMVSDGQVRLSVRARPPVSALTIVAGIGGGHARRAGGTLPAPADAAIREALRRATESLAAEDRDGR